MNIADDTIKKEHKLKWIVRFVTDKVKLESDAIGSAMPDEHHYMMDHFSTTPFLPMKSKVFMMKHIDAFEYRLPKFNRVYYKTYADVHLVVIYYAGEHPNNAPSITYHQSILIEQIIEDVKKLRHGEILHDQHTNNPACHGRKRPK